MSVLEATEIKRVFKYTQNGKTIKLDDIDSSMDFKEVVKFYASQYPEFTTASITGPEFSEDGHEMIYTIKTTVGTLG